MRARMRWKYACAQVGATSSRGTVAAAPLEAKLAPLFRFGDTRPKSTAQGGKLAIATGSTARALDVLVARPDHLEQADVLAERLGRKAPFGWKQILRWSGCQVLARGLDEARAARVARLASECGLTPRVRPSRQRGPFLSWISRNSGK